MHSLQFELCKHLLKVYILVVEKDSMFELLLCNNTLSLVVKLRKLGEFVRVYSAHVANEKVR